MADIFIKLLQRRPRASAPVGLAVGGPGVSPVEQRQGHNTPHILNVNADPLVLTTGQVQSPVVIKVCQLKVVGIGLISGPHDTPGRTFCIIQDIATIIAHRFRRHLAPLQLVSHVDLRYSVNYRGPHG